MPQLPPLSAVRVFEAAARHGNFTAAASELGMTQAAVSHQMKLLEDRLGQPLFVRQARGVALTALGQRLAPAVSGAFEALAAAFASVRAEQDTTLRISSIQTFAANWLASRLGQFQLTNSDLAVSLDVGGRLVDFAREDFDVGIRSGRGDWPGLDCHRLMPTTFTPMCSPDFAQRYALRSPADLLAAPLLSPDDSWWAIWFELAGVDAPGLAERRGLRVDAQYLLGPSAIAGHGVAILSPLIWRHELDSGRLVQPFDLVASDGHAIWLVYAAHRRRQRKIKLFREWLLPLVADSVA